MKNYVKSSVSAFAISLMVIGGVSVAGPAFAGPKVKNENSNNGLGNAASAGERANNGRGNSSSVEERSNNGRGSTASALGALNAAHANENAFLNASPNSRVGRIAIYQDAVAATFEAQSVADLAAEDLAAFGDYAPVYANYEEALAAYEASLLEPDAESVDFTIELAYWEAVGEVADADAAVEELQRLAQTSFFEMVTARNASEALAEFGDYAPVYANHEEALAAYEASLLESEAEAIDYDTELAYWEAVAAVADAEAAVAAAKAAEAEALGAAANKEVTEEVIASLWGLLDIKAPAE